MNMITLTIDGVSVTVPAGTTVLEAAKAAGIRIPTLCYLKGINEIGACRLCVVDTGGRALAASCVLPAANGMVVKTNTPAVRAARKMNLELLLSNHNKSCLSCVRNTHCELQALCQEYGVTDENRFEGAMTPHTVDDLSPSIVRDNTKCVLCRRCVAVCHKVQNVGVIGPAKRGFNTSIECAWGDSLADSACINCGQCIAVCPTGALHEKDDTQKVWDALNDPTKHVVVQPAPAVRAALGEEFGIPMGTSVTGKMATALHRLGFDKVFDTDFAADLTIMEEGYELIDRLQNGGTLPMITSCSPGWIKYCETFYPEFLPNVSSCKSPHEMMGAVVKSYYAETNGIDPRDIVVVSVMPCTAKKFECQRDELGHEKLPDVDIVITTRELARMIKQAGIDFARLPDGDFDEMLGDSTGAAVIFGVTGGVMEAALRTAYEVVTGKTLENVNFEAVRGLDGIKEAEIDLNGTKINVAIAHSTG
ncbi:MAG TPA: (2Fe-2S)-binding protein, partial [Candidatus Alectryocaccomicrobium excrementavium]|nr:(2Fe-2S)-binding protein [Candidatus Alectryocaccomicrobium excrementavium]